MRKIWWILLFILPSFGLMLRQGIYTMHDFHVFRQFEFDKCAREFSFPCRWAPDASFGYGQPLFNFYGQIPYWLGQIFHLVGFQIIDSTKLVFILSLVASALSMYLLARDLWGEKGAILSSIFYIYAPYRAVDIWVRGALNESLAFVFFPLILWSSKKLIETSKNSYVIWLSLALAGLILTHNLSFLMFAPFAAIWIIYLLVKTRNFRQILALAEAGLMAILLSAFYLLPVLGESYLVTLGKTTQDYYNFRLHYATLRQLFISNFWGYGGSTWGPNDTMSFSVGYLHWILGGVIIFLSFIYKKLANLRNLIWLLGVFALLAIFLTHGKSEIIWNNFPGLTFVQFPWRFLSLSTLWLAFLIGAWGIFLPRIGLCLILVGVFILNFNFFRPDIWRSVTDSEQFSGKLWEEQIASAISDFWPAQAPSLPDKPAPLVPELLVGTATVKTIYRGGQKFSYQIDVFSDYAKIRFPIVYFPGWKANNLEIFPEGDLGLITIRISQGSHTINLKFTDTWIRTLGNWTSGLMVIGMFVWGLKYAKK